MRPSYGAAPSQQEAYARDYLFKGRFLDIDLMQCAGTDGEYPYMEKGARAFYGRTCTVREALRIKAAYSAMGKATEKLRELAVRNGMSYRTLMRERNRFMKHTALMNLLSDPDRGEDTTDRYRNCCFYCRDYIIARHESAGRPSDNSIKRETEKLKDFPCSKCPYHPDVKDGPHGKGDYVPIATCRRGSEHMVIPKCRETVNLITSRIHAQETYMAWAGVRAWMSKCQHTVPRIKPELVNYVHFSDQGIHRNQ